MSNHLKFGEHTENCYSATWQDSDFGTIEPTRTIAFDGLGKPSNASLKLMLVSSELIARAVP